MSWKTDPGSVSKDAFSIAWNYCYGYCFPPFSSICKVFNKTRREFQLALLITLLWSTQSWFPSNSEISNSNATSVQKQTPSITSNNKDVSINSKTSAGNFYLIEQYIQNKELPKTQRTGSSLPGAIQPLIDTLQGIKNGSSFLF